MKLRYILAALAALILATAAQGQDLKPVKDKATKLYGYQDKSKNWVIPPAYEGAKRFKDGVAEVTMKPGKTKLHGVIDETGRIVIPIDCYAISFNPKEGLIMAEREAFPGAGFTWGVYDYIGREIWAPQFSASPVFNDGWGVARSASNGLKGLIDNDGQLLIPFDNLAIDRSFGGYSLLTKDFVRQSLDGRLNKTSEYIYPGYIIPYDPAGDPVRAAAWHVGPIGYRLQRNNLRAVQVTPGKWSNSATCSTLQIDWGNGRFVRLEPIEDSREHPGSMEDPISGKLYTVKAVLCEADGTLVGTLSEWGWIESEYSEGVIYNAEGRETWLIMRDINCPGMRSFSTSLTFGRTIDHNDVLSGLGIRSYELENMYEPLRYSDRALKILTGENAGITYRLPPETPSIRVSRAVREIHRTSLFRHRFRCGDIVSCKVRVSDEGVELNLADNMVCHYEDEFSSPYFRMDGEEVLYWGPDNEYTVVFSARQAPYGSEFTKDDLYGSDSSFEFALELYDGHDRFLQTIAVVPTVDYVSDGWIVLEREGIALRYMRGREHRPGSSMSASGRINLNCQRIPPTISALLKATD